MRITYQNAITWIANNDETAEKDPKELSKLISVVMLADISGKTPEKITQDILKERQLSP